MATKSTNPEDKYITDDSLRKDFRKRYKGNPKRILADYVNSRKKMSFFHNFLDMVAHDRTGELTKADWRPTAAGAFYGCVAQILLPNDFAKVLAAIRYFARCAVSPRRPSRSYVQVFTYDNATRCARGYFIGKIIMDFSMLVVYCSDPKKGGKPDLWEIPAQVCHALNAYDVHDIHKALLELPKMYDIEPRNLAQQVIEGFAKDIIWSIKEQKNATILWDEFTCIKNYFVCRILRDREAAQVVRSMILQSNVTKEELSLFVTRKSEFRPLLKQDTLEKAMRIIFEPEDDQGHDQADKKESFEEIKENLQLASELSYSMANLPNTTFSTQETFENCHDQVLSTGAIQESNFMPNDQEPTYFYNNFTHPNYPYSDNPGQETGTGLFPNIMLSHEQNAECFPPKPLGPFNQPELAGHYHQNAGYPWTAESWKFWEQNAYANPSTYQTDQKPPIYPMPPSPCCQFHQYQFCPGCTYPCHPYAVANPYPLINQPW